MLGIDVWGMNGRVVGTVRYEGFERICGLTLKTGGWLGDKGQGSEVISNYEFVERVSIERKCLLFQYRTTRVS